MARPPLEATPSASDSDDNRPTRSRRSVLAAAGGVGLASLAGCLDVTHAPTAYCQLKVVSVSWRGPTNRWQDDVAWMVGDDGDESLYGRVAEELPATVDGPRDLTIDDETHERLTNVFEDVSYLVGFCGTAFGDGDGENDVGCRNTDAASRADFNRVQVADTARVTLTDDEFRVHSVDAADTSDWESEFHRQDFSKLHADDSLPAAWADADD